MNTEFSTSLGMRISVWLVNAAARLGEAAVMRFPIETDE